MKINTTVFLKTLRGDIMKEKEGGDDLTLGMALGNIFSNSTDTAGSFTAYKAFKYAMDFYEKEEIDLNDADFDEIVKFLDHLTGYPSIVTGQIVGMLKKAKEDSEKTA